MSTEKRRRSSEEEDDDDQEPTTSTDVRNSLSVEKAKESITRISLFRLNSLSKDACRVCNKNRLLRDMTELRCWWERIFVYLSMYYNKRISEEDAIKMYKKSEKCFNSRSSFRNTFNICSEHIASIGRDILESVGIKDPRNVQQNDRRKLEKMIKLSNSMEDTKPMGRTNFICNLENFLGYKWTRLLKLYNIKESEGLPIITEYNGADEQENTKKKRKSVKREPSYEEFEEEEEEEEEDDDEIEDEKWEEEENSDEEEEEEYVPEEEEEEQVQYEEKCIAEEDEEHVQEEEEEEYAEDESNEASEETSFHSVEKPDDKEDSIERTFERQESWSPPAESPLPPAQIFEPSPVTDTKNEETSKKEIKKLRDCKICKARVFGIDLRGSWSKRFVLYTALARGQINIKRCSNIQESGSRLFICNSHAGNAAEKLIQCFGVSDPLDFDESYANPAIKAEVDQLTAEIAAMFGLGQFETGSFIRHARGFVTAHGKDIKPDRLTGRSPSMDTPGPSSHEHGNVSPRKRSFVGVGQAASPLDSSSESPHKKARSSTSPIGFQSPTSSLSESDIPSSSSSSSRKPKRRKCQICDTSHLEQDLAMFYNWFESLCVLATLHFCHDWDEDRIKRLYETRIMLSTGAKMYICIEHAREAGPDLLRYLEIENVSQGYDVSYDRIQPLRELFNRIDGNQQIPREFERFVDRCMRFVTKCSSK